jgi:hypothetical protein
VDRVRVHPVDERGGVVKVERTRRFHTLGAENGHGELVTELAVGSCREKV